MLSWRMRRKRRQTNCNECWTLRLELSPHEEVRAWLVAASSHWAALAWYTRASHVQAQCHDVQLSTWSSAAVPARLLSTSLWCRVTAWHHLRSVGRRLLNVPHQRQSTFARWAFSLAGPLVWNSLSDYLRDPAVSRRTFCKHLKTFLFAVYWYTCTFSALEVLLQCAISIYVLLTYLQYLLWWLLLSYIPYSIWDE